MAAYTKQTWDTTSIFNPSRMNHIEQGIYDASTNVNDVNVYATQDNKVVLRVNNKVVDLYLEANVSGAISADGIQLPNGIKPARNVFFVGKSGDNWYQPYKVDTNGLLTARSGNTVNAIAVDWALGHTTFVI